MLIIEKLQEYLKNNRKSYESNLKESLSTVSYYSGGVEAIDNVIEWVNSLPNEKEIDEIIKRLNGCNEETRKEYSYRGFNYEELLQLKNEIK